MSDRRNVAVAALDDRGLDAAVSPHFGRCPWYSVVELRGGKPTGARVFAAAAAGPHGPGRMPAYVASLGADAVLSGGMGPRAIQLFESMGIEVATGATGTVRDAVEAFVAGTLRGVGPCAHDHADGCGGHHGDDEHGCHGQHDHDCGHHA